MSLLFFLPEARIKSKIVHRLWLSVYLFSFILKYFFSFSLCFLALKILKSKQIILYNVFQSGFVSFFSHDWNQVIYLGQEYHRTDDVSFSKHPDQRHMIPDIGLYQYRDFRFDDLINCEVN